MPQTRDPKNGRYTSGGGSSVGGAAGTNPRIQKARAVGGGATAGSSPGSAGISSIKDDLSSKLSGKKYNEYEGTDYEFSVSSKGTSVKVSVKAYDTKFDTDTISYQPKSGTYKWKGYEGAGGTYKSASEASKAVTDYWKDAGIVL